MILVLILTGTAPVSQAYRDQETGTFLTRDPIGYQDGPNIYCYVHGNPITHFDAFGLNIWLITYATEKNETGHSIIAVSNYGADGKPDGTATYFDVRAANGKDKLSANFSVKADYDKATGAAPKADRMDKNADGLIELKTDSSMDQSAKDALETYRKENPSFSGKDANCTDYTTAGIQGGTGDKIDDSENIKIILQGVD